MTDAQRRGLLRAVARCGHEGAWVYEVRLLLRRRFSEGWIRLGLAELVEVHLLNRSTGSHGVSIYTLTATGRELLSPPRRRRGRRRRVREAPPLR